MLTDELDYALPAEAIAQAPTEPRDAARLLVDRGNGRPAEHRHVRDLPGELRAGDLVVVNDTRVLPARVVVRRTTGGPGEILLLEEIAEDDGGASGWWVALVRPSRKLRPGEVVRSERGQLTFELGEDLGEGRRLVRPLHDGDLLAALDAAGEVPLPPYLHGVLDEPERYQTVYAARPASAAAPTAGLHITEAVLAGIDAVGAGLARVELVVGLDTFRPVATERLEDHRIHSERYDVPAATWDAVEATRAAGHRVVAIGTTSVRALESVGATGRRSGRTELFITPGFEWRSVDVLLTNFHLPRSTLLALVQAFAGPRWRDLYAEALGAGYRFLSFGDAMLLQRSSA
jgi:S-adenosylmethionine:tRNA ribosyltransferase-isomerase